MTDSGPMEPPAPSPEMVTASRRHLTVKYANGIDRLLWELEKRPMADGDAVRAVIAAAAAEVPVDALDLGAGLVLMRAMRLDLDLLEADLLDAAAASGVSSESLAAVLDMPDAQTVQARHRTMAARREVPRAPDQAGSPAQPSTSGEAASRAGRRAELAARRAADAGRRRQELRRRAGEGELVTDDESRSADAARASAYAGEARVNAKDAAERVALGLLRAADSLERTASWCEEWQGGKTDQEQDLLRHRAGEYARAARTYREIASRYRDIGKQLS